MNKLYRFLFTKVVIMTFFLCSFFSLQAQHVWTGNVDTDWNNPANWNTNQVPTSGSSATIPGSATNGNFPIFDGDPVIDYTIQNAGMITFNSFVFNTGTIINYSVGQLVSNNFFVNVGTVVFDNDGYFDNNGIFENYGAFDNALSAVFNNNTNAAFSNYGVFTNYGNLNNNGAFINAGDFLSTQTFNNQGTVTNYGNFDNTFGSTYQNNVGGSIQNNDGAILSSNGTFNNASTLQNDGELILNFGANFTNDGDITNNKRIANSGQFFNHTTIQNNGTIRNNDAALIENNAVLQNNGVIDNGICAKLIQQVNNTIGGVVENNGGLIYVLAGAINVTGGELGYEFTDLSQTAPPVPGCKPNVQISLDVTGVATVEVTDIDNGSYGNCGAVITDRTVTPNTFGVVDIGQQVVTLSITDEFNLTATCDAIIQILEYVAPLAAIDDPDVDMTCPENISLTTLPGANTAIASWTVPTGTSNCSSNPPADDCSTTPSSFPNMIYIGEYNGSKYFCSENNVTYSQGRQLASQVGGYLAVINDAAENEYIRSHIMASSAWIGYNDEANEGTYVWEGGQNSSYHNWDAGQPNNYGGDEDYTRLLRSNGKWTDRNASVYLEAVIEIPCGAVASCTNVSENIAGLVFMGEYSGSKYFCSQSNLTYLQGRQMASQVGGYLAVINDAAENEYIRSHIMASSAWIGYSDEANEGTYVWEGSQSSSYTNWDSGQPNNYGGDEDYTRLLQSNGKWTDRDEYVYLEAVIEIPCGSGTGGGTGELVIEQIEGQPNGSEFFAGTTQIAYRGTDDCGNEEVCLFEVVVEKTPSEITVNCPVNLVIDAPPGAESAVVTWATPTGTSNCFSDTGVQVSRNSEGLESGDAFPVGTTNISYVLRDSCGTLATCSFAVTVNEAPTTLTLLSCPEDITGNNPISWAEPTASTTCFTGNIQVRQIEGTPNGGNFPEGTSQVSYLISDDCGNVEQCTFYVTSDGAQPSGTGVLTIYCPDDQIGRAAVGESSTVVNWTAPTASTTCSTSSDVVVTQIDGLPNGSEFPVGTSMVTVQATDNCGNVETCTFKIMVTNEACDISASVSNILCDDNGTPNDTSDDTFTFDVLVTGVGNPWGWTGGGQTVEYDQVTEFGPYDISDGTVSFGITDTDNPSCTTSISVDAPTPCSSVPVACNKDLLFVVGNTNLNAGDAVVKTRMELLNYQITVIDDNIVQASDGDGRGLIVISSTVNSTNIRTTFRDIAVPVITWEAWLYDDMNMTGTGSRVNYGDYQYEHRVEIMDTSHPIAAGLSGTTDVLETSSTLNWGRPSSDASTIACLPSDESKVLVFAYEAGSSMVGLTAPARRVGFFFRNATPEDMTTAGWQMFDAALTWTGGCTPSSQQLVRAENNDMFEFVVNKEKERAGLYWVNNTGMVNDLYTIEKSIDGVNFETIGEVNAYQEDNQPATFAQYDEQLVDGKNYYRIKLDYLDGSFVYSDVSVVDFSQTADFTVFPNPAADYTNIDLKAFIGKEVEVFIYNQSNQLVKRENLGQLHQPFKHLDLNTLQNGIHTIHVVTSGRKIAKKLLVTRLY